MKIVKVQLPMMTTGAIEQMLVYDRTRSHICEVLKSKQPAAYAMMKETGEVKAFCYADLNADGNWIIDVERGFAPWQSW